MAQIKLMVMKWAVFSYRFWFRLGVGVAIGGLLSGERGWNIPIFFWWGRVSP